MMSDQSKNEALKTTCTECNSSFQLNLSQLLAADGRVRCSQCHEIFDANICLIRNHKSGEEHSIQTTQQTELDIYDELAEDAQAVSLTDAMHGNDSNSTSTNMANMYWPIGILLLIAIGLVQWIYYDRLQLIKNPDKQSIVLTLCSIIPCDTSQFKSTHQFTLIERNIFTHPTRANALLISGSFINEAPFTQKAPSLKISLFNLNGNIIAQRLFLPIEYQQGGKPLGKIAPGESIHFKLEVEDPDTVTITYEFDFL